MNKYYAYPYDPSATGFYFTSLEDFKRKYKQNLPAKKYKISFVDGDKKAYKAFKAMQIDQEQLPQWFDFLERWDDFDNELLAALLTEDDQSDFPEAWDDLSATEKVAYTWLTSDLGYEPEEAARLASDVIVYPGTLLDYTYDFVAELEPDDPILQQHIDFEQIGEEVRADIDPDYDEEFANLIDGMSDREVGEYVVNEGLFDMRKLKKYTYIDYRDLARTLRDSGEAIPYDDEITGDTYVIANANEF